MKISIRSTLPAPTPKEILDLFQQAATVHGEEMGVGFNAMLEKGLLWVVTRIRYKVLKMPAEGQKVEVCTWPLPATRLGFERNYLVCDQAGEPLIAGNSLWMVIDTATRKLADGAGIYPQGEYCTEKTFQERARRIRDFEGTPAGTVIPDARHIDHNGHVNNTHYAAFAARALGDVIPTAFQIDYLREVLQGQPLHLFTEGNTVRGTDDAGTTMFLCELSQK